MYFETKMHTRRPVQNALEAAKLIHEKKARDFDALSWKSPDGRELIAVGDNHCNNTWLEVAVIDVTNGIQLESITMGWIETLEEKHRYLKECETSDFKMRPVKIPLDGQNDTTAASFECSCCGKFFESTLAVEKKHDFDNGYGLCKACA